MKLLWKTNQPWEHEDTRSQVQDKKIKICSNKEIIHELPLKLYWFRMKEMTAYIKKFTSTEGKHALSANCANDFQRKRLI